MRKITIIFTFLLSLAANAQGFWTQVAPFPTSTNINVNQISIVNDTDIWVVGNSNYLLGTTNSLSSFSTSTDGGYNWQSGTIDFGSNTMNVSSLFAISARKAYVTAFDSTAAGSSIPNSGVWVTEDYGATWNKQPTALFNSFDSFPNFIHFFNQDNGIVVGDPINGVFEIYTTTNGGLNWTQVPASNIPVANFQEYGYTLNFATINNDIWFGTSNGRIFKSNNQGLDWTVNQSPIPDFGRLSSSNLGTFTFKNSNEGLLVSEDYRIWRTLDGGITWNDETTTYSGPLRNSLTVCVPNTINTYFSAGSYAADTVSRGSSYSNDGGQNWIDLNDPVAPITPVEPIIVAFKSGDTAFCIGYEMVPNQPISGYNFYKLTSPLLRTLKSDAFDLFNVSIKVNPNPSNGVFKISANSALKTIELFDVSGKRIETISINNVNLFELNLSNYENGIYFAKIYNAENNFSIQRLIKN